MPGVPKTLVRYLVEWAADVEFSGEASAVLHDIIAHAHHPGAAAARCGGRIWSRRPKRPSAPTSCTTSSSIYTVRYQFAPEQGLYLGPPGLRRRCTDEETILHWLEVFYRRFFSQQFKRSAMPDGPKVGSVALSPRGDWRMPSDASAALWLAEIEEVRAATLTVRSAQFPAPLMRQVSLNPPARTCGAAVDRGYKRAGSPPCPPQ